MARKLSIVLFVILSALLYQQIQPPPPKICGSLNGPPVTAPRTKLKDGRHLAYKESGVPKEEAKYKIIFVHGFDSCRHDALPISPVHIVNYYLKNHPDEQSTALTRSDCHVMV
jgi:hypothetical protein